MKFRTSMFIVPLLAFALAGWAAAATPLDLATVTNTNLAFEIKVPKGYKTLADDKYAATYSFALDARGMNSIDVTIAPAVGVSSLDGAVSDATMMGTKAIAEKKEVEKGTYLIVKAPEAPLSGQQSQEVWFFRGGQPKPLRAKCSGPADRKAQLVEICSSLKLKPKTK